MKKIRLFSTKVIKSIEGQDAELYVNFYLVLNKNYIFTFLIDTPNLSCSGRRPIKLWKHFLIMLEEESVKYMRRYEMCIDTVSRQAILNEIHNAQESLKTNNNILWEINKNYYKGLAWARRIVLDTPPVLHKCEESEVRNE